MEGTDPSLEAAEGEALALLDRLCREPSVSAEESALSETAELVEEMLGESGFETQQLLVEGAPPVVYGEQVGRSRYTLLLYNHYDVQPVDPVELWESPPFEKSARGIHAGLWTVSEPLLSLAARRARRAARLETCTGVVVSMPAGFVAIMRFSAV